MVKPINTQAPIHIRLEAVQWLVIYGWLRAHSDRPVFLTEAIEEIFGLEGR